VPRYTSPVRHFARYGLLCLVTTMASTTAHELVHIAVGHAVGIGGHFTSLSSADWDPKLASAAPASARALMAGSAPVFTVIVAICALLIAPWARRRRHDDLATVLGWLAVFGIPYTGVQLMTLGGPAGGVDMAAVLVDYFGLAGIPRTMVAVGGVVFLIASGFWLGRALGVPSTSSPVSGPGRDMSLARRGAGITFVVVSVCLIAAGAVIRMRPEPGNPMGAFLLADVLWAAGMVVLTPWRQPGPQFVRDMWLLPGIAAMALLTVIGVVFPSDYSAAAMFFLPQLATAAWAARTRGPRHA